MTSRNGLMGPNNKFLLGIAMLIILMFYVGDKLIKHSEILPFDWFSWSIMVLISAFAIIDGIRTRRK